jgi:hypothetical protein
MQLTQTNRDIPLRTQHSVSILLNPQYLLRRPTQLPVLRGPGRFSGGNAAGAWRWPPTHHLAPRLKCRAIHLLTLWAFVACYRVTFTLPLRCSHVPITGLSTQLNPTHIVPHTQTCVIVSLKSCLCAQHTEQEKYISNHSWHWVEVSGQLHVLAALSPRTEHSTSAL